MSKPFILHMFSSEKNLSPFDVNMAIDAGWTSTIPYINVELDEICGLVQDTIFSRSPKGLKNTAIFIGGRDPKLAMGMLKAASKSMFPPFQTSIFADPSGAFTTAAAMVAAVEDELVTQFNANLQGQSVLVLGGTGPVGQVVAALAAQAGAQVRIIGRQLEKTQHIADIWNQEQGAGEVTINCGLNADKANYIQTADVVFATGAAGIELLSDALLATATQLKVAADVNAVPPSGVAGLDPFDNGKAIAGSCSGAIGVGALAIGNIKYQVQSQLLKQIIDSEEATNLHYKHAFTAARNYIQAAK